MPGARDERCSLAQPLLPAMGVMRQGRRFVLVGLAQLVLDWLLFISLSAAGMPVSGSNVGGRLAGMLLGFWLNGRYTFARPGQQQLGWRRFFRFLGIWILLTVVSTLLVERIAAALGLGHAWLAKPVVEAALALLSFVLMRSVVYR